MYGVEMYYTIKTLLEQGKSQREISRQLGIHRKTVRKIKLSIEAERLHPVVALRPKRLDSYRDQIEVRLATQTARLIYEWLRHEEGIAVSYTTVARYVKGLKGKAEVYVPVLTAPGEEAQVDFGYLGYFDQCGNRVKVWSFSMVLGYSRYSYHELVLDQRVSTFIRCHIHAFEYFGGVPAQVKIDNLKSGVIQASFYEPLIQAEYAAFLSHYGTVAITARPARGQDKGKVESSVKYVKYNFLKRLRHRDHKRAVKDLAHWTDHICNKRIHGTTRKVPVEVYNNEEKPSMLVLPTQRFEWFEVSRRKVNRMGHISYANNYYSIPYQYSGEEVLVKSNGNVLRVYQHQDLLCIHALCREKGRYISREEHKPPYKQTKSEEYYRAKVAADWTRCTTVPSSPSRLQTSPLA